MSECGFATLLMPPRGADNVLVGLGDYYNQMINPASPSTSATRVTL